MHKDASPGHVTVNEIYNSDLTFCDKLLLVLTFVYNFMYKATQYMYVLRCFV